MLQNPTSSTAAVATTTTSSSSTSTTTNPAVAAAAGLQPKVVIIRRRPNQGYGFTLRHFIAYPPEDDEDDVDDGTWPQETTTTTHDQLKQKKQQVKAMETIFIKEVQPNGPAHYANLQTGDRVLMVNNQPIAGIAYSTIVSMIKQTPSVLTLHVVPKECDVLQMHYTSIAHTPESNRSSATAATLASFKPIAGYGNGTTVTAVTAPPTKSFSSQQQQQQQLISYTTGNNRLIGGANSLRGAEYNETTTSATSVHHHQQPQQQQQQHLQHYQQQQQSALLLRGESGFTLRNNATAPNVTVLARQQQQQQLQQQQIQVSSIYASDNSDLMIRLRESIKQKEEFLKSPLPHTHHPHSQQQQQQQQTTQNQQHFFPSNTPPAGSPQMSLVSTSSGSLNTGGARGQVRNLVKQPLSAASSTASSTRELLPGSYDLHNFYAKNLSFDSMMNRQSSSVMTEKTMTSSTSAYSALSTARLQQRQSSTNGNAKYGKDMDYMETLQETGGVTNKVFESKLVSHLSKGFDPFKPLSIQTSAGSTPTNNATSNIVDNTSGSNIKKAGVLYESLHQHPLHQMQLQQIQQQHPAQINNNNSNNINNNHNNNNNNNGGHVVDGQPCSRMEIHKATSANIEQNTNTGKYVIKTTEPEGKSVQNESFTASDVLSGLKATTDAVVRRLKPLAAFDDGNKLMRRISYLRATNHENEYQSDTSSVTTTTTTTSNSGNGSVALAPLVTTSEQIDEDADLDPDPDPLYDVVASDRTGEMTASSASEKQLNTPDSAKIGIRRSSLSSDIRNSVHTDNLICEFETFETKDVTTEMEVFETEMEIKASSINGKRSREFCSWRLAKIEIRGDILTIHSSRNTKSENNVIELDIRNLLVYDESADKKKYIFRIQSKPPLYMEDIPEKIIALNSSSSTSAMQNAEQQQQHPYTDILFKTKSINEMKRIFGLLQWKNSLIFEDSDLQGKQLAEPQKTAASASMPTATYCDENVQQQQQLQAEYSPRIGGGGGGDIETSDSISPVMKTRKSASHKNIPDKDLGSPKAKNWKDLLFRRGGGSGGGSNSSGADISPSGLAANTRTTGSIGVPLKLCPMSKNNEYVPTIVDVCTNIVETKGLSVVGIYRIPGNKAAISELSEQVNRQDFSWDRCNTDVRWEDVNVVSSLLKLFIRSLPDALLPTSFYNLFIEADKKTGLIRLKELKNLLESLPRHSYETMKHLIRHLSRVSKNCDVNLMEPKNLAIIFGPSIIRTPNDTLEIAVKDMKHQCRIVELLVTQYDYFFENGNTPDVADICGNGNGMNLSVTTSTASAQSQEEQTTMLLHNVAKIERFTERESSRTSRFIPALRRRTHSKRSAVSSDTYSGESQASLDYAHSKTVTASSSSSSSTNITTAHVASSVNSSTSTVVNSNTSSKKKERNFLVYNARTHYRKASLDEKDSAGSGSNSGGSMGKMEQRSSVDISILLTDDDESSHSRISDTGSMSLTTITDTLDTKLRNLRSGSESNDENCSPDLLKTRRHTLGQPLHLHSENIPYADESPERHFHATHPLDVATPNKSHKISRTCTADAKAVLDKPRTLLTPGALTYKTHKLQHSATAPISSSGISSPPAAASTPTAIKNSNTPCVSTATLPPSGGVLGRNFYTGKNLRFSSSVYEHCCSEDDSEGSTTSDPKESNLIINSPTYLIDRYNKKRRDHRLFRSASFNCRNYSTRHGHAHVHGGSSSGGTPTAGLTKDEKTDMNLTKKRQIQNKQSRSIKRRHTVGGPHDYAANATPTTYPNNITVVGNSCHHGHKTNSSLARRMPLSSANSNIANNNNSSHLASSDNGNSSAGSSGGGDNVDGSSSGVSSGGNEAPSRATVAVTAPGSDHVLEVGIRIKNINRSRY